MKKISLCILAIVFAGASVMATETVKAKKAKQATCKSCKKDKCPKNASCPSKGKCCK